MFFFFFFLDFFFFLNPNCIEVSALYLLLALLRASVHARLCLTLGDPTDCNPPGSSVRGIFQARIWERVAISSSRVSPAYSVSNFELFVGIKLDSTVAYRKRGLPNKPGGER